MNKEWKDYKMPERNDTNTEKENTHQKLQA